MSDANIKNPVVENDLVLVYINDQPAFYARVEGFEPDQKPKWWQVKLLALTYPAQMLTWILRREQINGEPFTMGGTPMKIEKVVVAESTPAQETAPAPPVEPPQPEKSREETPKQARILSLGGDKETQ